MADNVILNAGAGGSTLATDELADLTHVQYVKLMDGTADGTGKVAADAANGLDVDVTRLPALTAGTNLIGSVKISDGTDVALVTAGGLLQVDGSGVTQPVSGTVTAELGATDNAVLDTIAASASVMDDWDNGASDGASVSGDVAHDAADVGEPIKIGGFAKAAAPTNVSLDADRVNAWFLLNGAQATVITAAGALIGGDAANGLDVDVTRVTGTVTVNGSGVTQPVSGTFWQATQPVSAAALPLPAGASTSALQGGGLPAALGAGGGLKVDGSGTALPVSVASVPSHAVTNAGTFAVQADSVIPGTGATNLGKAEDAAHSSGDVGVAALGVRVDTPNATVAANGDYHYLATDLAGGVRTALYETDFAVLGTTHVKKFYTNAGAVTDGIVWSPAAGKRWYVTDIFINVSAAATVTLEDDLVAGDSAVWKAELAANSGWSHSFATPLFSGEDAADLLITTSAGNVYVTVTGYEI